MGWFGSGSRRLRRWGRSRSRSRSVNGDWGSGHPCCVELLHFLDLLVEEVRVGVILVPSTNELIEKQALWKCSSLFWGCPRTKAQQLQLDGNSRQ